MGCGCNPLSSGASSSSAAGVDLFADTGPVVPNSSTPTPDGPDHLATAIAGAPVFPAGSQMILTSFAQIAGDAAGLVRADVQAQYSFDGGTTWNPAPGAAAAVFTAIDATNPVATVSMAAQPVIALGGQATVRFRLLCENGVGAVAAADFSFLRSSWVYTPVTA